MTDAVASLPSDDELRARLDAEAFLAGLIADREADERGWPAGVGAPIAPGVPDVTSMRNALEMGYEMHADGLWWPTYDWSRWDHADWPKPAEKAKWPEAIHRQWARVGAKLYSSPCRLYTKREPV